jgi:hypothetical protein
MLKVLLSAIRDFIALQTQTQPDPLLVSFKLSLKCDIILWTSFTLESEKTKYWMLTGLRAICSFLASDLFDKNIAESLLCQCGNGENTYSFVLFYAPGHIVIEPSVRLSVQTRATLWGLVYRSHNNRYLWCHSFRCSCGVIFCIVGLKRQKK